MPHKTILVTLTMAGLFLDRPCFNMYVPTHNIHIFIYICVSLVGHRSKWASVERERALRVTGKVPSIVINL